MDPTTKALIETIGAAEYVIHLDAAGGGTMVVTAISEATGEAWVVRDADLYSAARWSQARAIGGFHLNRVARLSTIAG